MCGDKGQVGAHFMKVAVLRQSSARSCEIAGRPEWDPTSHLVASERVCFINLFRSFLEVPSCLLSNTLNLEEVFLPLLANRHASSK